MRNKHVPGPTSNKFICGGQPWPSQDQGMWPPEGVLGCKTIKSTGYSHESKETITSSNIPFGLILDLSAHSKTVGVGRRLRNYNCSMVCNVMILMAAPKSIRVFWTRTLLMCTETIKLPRSWYFSTQICPDMTSVDLPTNWIFVGSIFFLLGFFTQSSLMILA